MTKSQPPNACISPACGLARQVTLYTNLAGKAYFKKRAVAIRLQMLVGRGLAHPCAALATPPPPEDSQPRSPSPPTGPPPLPQNPATRPNRHRLSGHCAAVPGKVSFIFHHLRQQSNLQLN